MKKRFLSAVLVVTILLTLAASVNAAVTRRIAPEYTYRTVFDSANIRESPSASSGAVVTVGLHKIVYDYLKRNTADYWVYSKTNWTKVTYGSNTGYLRNDLMAPTASYYVATADLNVRDSANGTILHTIENGTEIALCGMSKTTGGYVWQKIVVLDGDYNYRGTVGWVASDYIAPLSA